MGFERRLADLATRLLDRGGVLPAVARAAGGGHIVLYHGVVERVDDARVQLIHLPLAEFRRQLAWLRRRRVLVSAAEVGAALRGEATLPRGWVLVTFDDGYRNNHDLVADVMAGLPWVVYVSTRHIDEGLRFPTYRLRRAVFHARGSRLRIPALGIDAPLGSEADRNAAARLASRRLKEASREVHDAALDEADAALSDDLRQTLDARFDSDATMSWDQVRALDRAGVAVGGHGHDHLILHPRQDAAEVARQVATSATRLEAELGHAPETFAYPNGGPGDVSLAALEALARGPYRWAVTTVADACRPGQPPLLLPRIIGGTLEGIMRQTLPRRVGLRAIDGALRRAAASRSAR